VRPFLVVKHSLWEKVLAKETPARKGGKTLIWIRHRAIDKKAESHGVKLQRDDNERGNSGETEWRKKRRRD